MPQLSFTTILPAGTNGFKYEGGQLWEAGSVKNSVEGIVLNLAPSEYFKIDYDDKSDPMTCLIQEGLSYRDDELIITYPFYRALRNDKDNKTSCLVMRSLISLMKIPGINGDIATLCKNEIKRNTPMLLDDLAEQSSKYSEYESINVIHDSTLRNVFENWLIRRGDAFYNSVMDLTLIKIGFVMVPFLDHGNFEVGGPGSMNKGGPGGISIWETILDEDLIVYKNIHGEDTLDECDISTVISIAGNIQSLIPFNEVKDTLFWYLFNYHKLDYKEYFDSNQFFIALNEVLMEVSEDVQITSD